MECRIIKLGSPIITGPKITVDFKSIPRKGDWILLSSKELADFQEEGEIPEYQVEEVRFYTDGLIEVLVSSVMDPDFEKS